MPRARRYVAKRPRVELVADDIAAQVGLLASTPRLRLLHRLACGKVQCGIVGLRGGSLL